ncbi:MAG: glycoside hydrolase family 19 protein [Beijerinckiaceae bacterium]
MSFDKAGFYAVVRKGILGPKLDAGEVEGCETILDAMVGLPASWCAYALATAYHETAHTMQPIMEYGGPKYFTRMYDVTGSRPRLAHDMGNTAPGDGPKYCGRGFVQLTWKANYAKAGAKLGVDLVANPARAMEPAIAAKIMREGMVEGWFTGKALRHYLPDARGTLAQYTAARKIINGTDKAAMIAGYAMQFEGALVAGGWA